MRGEGFTVWIPHSLQRTPSDANADVHVQVANGEVYSGTFYTLENVAFLLKRFEQTGECAAGRFFFDPSMVLVRDLEEDTILMVVAELLATGELRKAFLRGCDEGGGAT